MKISPFFSKDAAKPPSSSYARRVVAFGDIVSQCQSCCEGKNEEALSFQYDMKCEEQFFVNSSSFGFGSFGEHTARRTSKCSSSWSSSLDCLCDVSDRYDYFDRLLMTLIWKLMIHLSRTYIDSRLCSSRHSS